MYRSEFYDFYYFPAVISIGSQVYFPRSLFFSKSHFVVTSFYISFIFCPPPHIVTLNTNLSKSYHSFWSFSTLSYQPITIQPFLEHFTRVLFLDGLLRFYYLPHLHFDTTLQCTISATFQFLSHLTFIFPHLLDSANTDIKHRLLTLPNIVH